MTTEKSPFVHLHVHSEYSLVDGTTVIKDLVKKAKELGHTHLALTDHANMHGAIEFYSAAKQAGIYPIIGCELYHAASHLTEKALEEAGIKEPSSYIFQRVLLAKNNAGYKNLMKLTSDGYIGENLKTVPVTSSQAFSQYNSDLFVLLSAHNGELSTLVSAWRHLSGKAELNFSSEESSIKLIVEALKSHRNELLNIYGADNVYVELVDNNLPHQKQLNQDLYKAAQFLGLPVVVTGNVHYLENDFLDCHALAISVRNSLTMKDIRNRHRDARFHFMSDAEIEKAHSQWPEAIANSLKIAKSCEELTVEMGKFYLPKINLGTDETPKDAFIRLSRAGLLERFTGFERDYENFDEEKKQIYWQRLEYELSVIIQMGFQDYFLIVSDFIQWAKSQDIPVGPGRGSGAGSLVAYALKITDLDPIPYNLIFERFLNPERVSMPDFDIDFCQWRREEVIQYCVRKYGANNVAQITTFGKLQAKGAVKSVGRAMNIGFNRMDRFTKLFPKDLGITLTDAMEKEPRIKEEMGKDEALRESMEYALKIEGLVSHTSVHAAGLVMSEGGITNFVPVYTTDGKNLITQYEMKPTEKVGLVKFDFLGLKTLTVIDKAVRLIRRDLDEKFDISRISLKDTAVYEMLSAGFTCGVFQCESHGMTELIKKLKPSVFEDIIALVALFRPGPLGSGMVDDFIERKHGRQKISYLHPLLASILKDTYGMILYQEQVQKIAATLANYSLGEADLLRRAMGKKNPEEMAQQKNRFVEGCEKNEISKDLATEIFDLMAEFANYGFNKSHSAAYGLVSYQTAYLKKHFPEQFLAASMTLDMDNSDKILRYVEDAKRLGLQVISPNINESGVEFDVRGPKKIIFGLAAIKGIGSSVLGTLIENRDKEGPYMGLTHLAKRIHLGKFGKKTLLTLAQVGALDQFKIPRKEYEWLVPDLVKYSIDLHEAKNKGQRGLFDFTPAIASEEKPLWDQPSFPSYVGLSIWNNTDLMAEKKLLGVFLSGHPLSAFRHDVDSFGARIENLPLDLGKKKIPVSLVGLLAQYNLKRTKKGSMMASLRIEQENHAIETVMFADHLSTKTLPALNTIIIAQGSWEQRFNEPTPRFVLESIKSLEDYRKEKVTAMRLGLSLKNLEIEKGQTLKLLEQLLKKEEGTCSVEMGLKLAKVSLRIKHKPFFVSATDDLLEGLVRMPNIEVKVNYTSLQVTA